MTILWSSFRYSETLYTSGADINTQIGEKLREMETTLLSWTEENSQISKLNNADGKTMEVSDDLAADLEKIRQLSQDSNGAFDPTLGKVIHLNFLVAHFGKKGVDFGLIWDMRVLAVNVPQADNFSKGGVKSTVGILEKAWAVI